MLIEEVTAFARDRCWLNKYSKMPLSFYLLEEVGELAKVLNSLPSTELLCSLRDSAFDALCSEIADIAIYLKIACVSRALYQLSKALLQTKERSDCNPTLAEP